MESNYDFKAYKTPKDFESKLTTSDFIFTVFFWGENDISFNKLQIRCRFLDFDGRRAVPET